MNKTIEVNKEFAKFIGKDVIVGFKNNTETSGKVESVDNYLNIVLAVENGIKMIKGEKVAYVSMKED